MEEFLAAHWLDMLTTALGLAYIILEYHASIWLWAVGFAMQSLGIVLYYQKGLYADCGMEFYYLAMTVYGYFNWMRKKSPSSQGEKSESTPITSWLSRPHSLPRAFHWPTLSQQPFRSWASGRWPVSTWSNGSSGLSSTSSPVVSTSTKTFRSRPVSTLFTSSSPSSAIASGVA